MIYDDDARYIESDQSYTWAQVFHCVAALEWNE